MPKRKRRKIYKIKYRKKGRKGRLTTYTVGTSKKSIKAGVKKRGYVPLAINTTGIRLPRKGFKKLFG